MVFMVGQLLGLSALSLVTVNRIFARVTPTLRADLETKVKRAARELANAADLSLAAGDPVGIYKSFGDLQQDRDIRALAAVNVKGNLIAGHGALPGNPSKLFEGPPNEAIAREGALVAWSEVSVEDTPVGRVAAVVSLSRLDDGKNLRTVLLVLGAVLSGVALVASALFVNLYIGPLIALTQTSLEQAREMVIAKTIQTSLLPAAGDLAKYEIAASMRPADDVGGDYYDVIPDPAGDGVWIAIGDVSGHGLQAGLIMLMVESSVFSLISSQPDISPRALVSALNDTLHENIRKRMGHDDFVTFTILRCRDNGEVTLAGAHEEALVWRASTQRCELVAPKGVWLGLRARIGHLLHEATLSLQEGDALLLYTDGITEGLTADGQPFGLERLVSFFEAHAMQPPKAVERALLAVRGELNREDDMTVVVARYGSRTHVRAPISSSGSRPA